MSKQLCEFCQVREATVYGGYQGGSSWAGYACDECAKYNGQRFGFRIWERVAR